ncbi:hypothetical protein ACFL4D_03030 [Candidatus Margulisiibacteriota bacterium]
MTYPAQPLTTNHWSTIDLMTYRPNDPKTNPPTPPQILRSAAQNDVPDQPLTTNH